MLNMRFYQSTFLSTLPRAGIPANFGANVTWTNMPAAQNDMYSGTAQDTLKQWYGSFPLSYFEFGAFGANMGVAGSAGALIRVQYSTDGVNYSDMEPPTVTLAINTTGQKLGQFSIPDAAKAVQDCFVRVRGEGGNAVADPRFDVGSGLNGVIFGVPAFNFVVNVDPPPFSARVTRKRQMVIFNTFFSFGTLTWTNMPAAQTEWFGLTTRRITAFFTTNGMGMVKLVFNMAVAGSVNATMMLQYSLDAGASWKFIDSETTNTGAPCNIGATGWRQSASYVKVDEAAKVVAGVLCRMVGVNGNGVADPQFSGGSTGHIQGVHFDPAS